MTDPQQGPRAARRAARTATAFAASMFFLSAWVTLDSDLDPASAAATAGQAAIVVPSDGSGTPQAPLLAGGSATPFALDLPNGAACTGDSASGGYRLQSYLIPSGVGPATLTFGPSGPLPTGLGAALRQPLFADTGAPYVNAQTDIATTAGGGGGISGVPAFSFEVFGEEDPGSVPAGTYDLGIACTKGPASETQLDRFWNARITVVADSTDEPAGFRFTVVDAPPPTTSTLPPSTTSSSTGSTSSTTSASTTSSTSSTTSTTGSTTTTTGSTTTTSTTRPTTTSTSSTSTSTTSTTRPTTTTTGSTSTTGPTSTSTSTTTAGFGGFSSTTTTPVQVLGVSQTNTGSPLTGSLSRLPVTGGSASLVVWGVLLVVFGRMAILLGRSPRPTASRP